MRFAKFRFDADDEELSRFARALCLPVRISILKIIVRKTSWVSIDVFTGLSLTPITRDRHLRALKDLGIIIEKQQSGIILYHVNEVVFQKLIEDFKLFFDLYKSTRVNS